MVADRQLSRKGFDDDMCSFVVEGEPCSKANSRRLVVISGRMVPIKSEKALRYSKLFARQCPTRGEIFTEDLIVCIKIWYKTRRPDLDESLILDLMEGNIYHNDRSVKLKYIEHGLCRDASKALILVAPLELKKKAMSRFEELLEGYDFQESQL